MLSVDLSGPFILRAAAFVIQHIFTTPLLCLFCLFRVTELGESSLLTYLNVVGLQIQALESTFEINNLQNVGPSDTYL